MTFMVWLNESKFPQVSTKVHVRNMEKSFGQEPGVTTVVGLTVISPSQLSMAVISTGGGTSSAHSKNKTGTGRF